MRSMDMYVMDKLFDNLAHRDHKNTLRFAHNIHAYRAQFHSVFVCLVVFGIQILNFVFFFYFQIDFQEKEKQKKFKIATTAIDFKQFKWQTTYMHWR